ncbi:MAG: 2OG-Fe(II) oxygenase [Hyphomicrobiaceae bacterium]|nr:2OG-Fe(II) oxygenase [Hyphomicrobiaceae bacterium]
MPSSKDAVIASLIKSFEAAPRREQPYPHWYLENCLPAADVAELTALPFPAPALGGISGKREIHNATRQYFDAANMEKYPACKTLNESLQDRRLTSTVERVFGTNVAGNYLRVEFAQDTDGFWLEPHTDLGVKTFTFLLYLSAGAGHEKLGTDIYDANKVHLGSSPFQPNGALVFVPSTNTYHGFEPKTIEGVRKSIIINYVTNDWRAREQLAYPNTPVA